MRVLTMIESIYKHFNKKIFISGLKHCKPIIMIVSQNTKKWTIQISKTLYKRIVEKEIFIFVFFVFLLFMQLNFSWSGLLCL